MEMGWEAMNDWRLDWRRFFFGRFGGMQWDRYDESGKIEVNEGFRVWVF